MIVTSFIKLTTNCACGIHRLNVHIICTVLKTAIYTFIELNRLSIHLIELNKLSIHVKELNRLSINLIELNRLSIHLIELNRLSIPQECMNM